MESELRGVRRLAIILQRESGVPGFKPALPDPKALVTHQWPHSLDASLFPKTKACSICQPQQRQKEGAQWSH